MNVLWLAFMSTYEAIIWLSIFCNLTKIKHNKAETAFLYLLIVLSHISLSLAVVVQFGNFIQYAVSMTFNIFVVILFTAICYRKIKNIFLCGFYACLLASILLISNTLVVALAMLVGAIETFDVSGRFFEEFVLTTAAVTSVFIFAFIGSRYAGNKLHKKMSTLDDDMKNKCAKYLFGGALIVYILLLYHVFLQYAFADTAMQSVVYVFILSSFAIFLFFTVFTFTDTVKKQMESTQREKEKEYYFAQCQLMQESVQQMKSVRHDIKIHMAVIKGYSENNADKIPNYVNALLDNINDDEIYSDTGNVAVDSIVNYKLRNAKQEGIKTEMRLQIPSTINIEGIDIATILGNLLDNALTAVSTVDEKTIRLSIEYSKGVLFIQINNTFDGIVNYEDGTARLRTRKDEKEHGHGLKNITRSIEKYNGHMDITHEGNVFSVTVMLYAS